MSTSFLYHGFGIVGYKYVSTRYESGAIVFQVTEERLCLSCPTANSVVLSDREKIEKLQDDTHRGKTRVHLFQIEDVCAT